MWLYQCVFTTHRVMFGQRRDGRSEKVQNQMILHVDKHDWNSNPHSRSAWMISQEGEQVRGIQIAFSQLIKMLLIVNDERGICTHILQSGTPQLSRIWLKTQLSELNSHSPSNEWSGNPSVLTHFLTIIPILWLDFIHLLDPLRLVMSCRYRAAAASIRLTRCSRGGEWGSRTAAPSGEWVMTEWARQ